MAACTALSARPVHIDGFRAPFLNRLGIAASNQNYRGTVEQVLDELADHIERHLDVEGPARASR